ncbi:hypothetical protein KJ765_01550 [Candidatus Micrarchaeota archaeon]|nr:hypothetical protein [Candidatus Micrarchaeota archaeon]
MHKKNRGQTATEYLFLIGGAILFVLLIILMLRGSVISSSSHKISADMDRFFNDYARYYLFYESFDSGNAYRWTPDQGTWGIENSEYLGIGAGNSTVAVTLHNFSMNAFIRTSSNGGLIFRKRNASNYYAVMVNVGNTVQLTRTTDGNTALLAGPAAFTGDLQEGVYLRADANGTNVTIYVNNIAYLSVNDLTEPLRLGHIGVTSPVDAQAVFFDNIRVFQCVGQCGT